MSGLRIAVSYKQTGKQVIAALHKIDPKGISTFNHVYSPARGAASGEETEVRAGIAAIPAERTAARIGLVDAGVDATHPLLKGVKISARAFGMGATTVENHGTAVASRIAEVAPGATLVVASVFSEMKNGEEIASVDAIARGLDWLSRNDVPVINLSLSGPANPILEAVTARLIAQGHVLVAAVGNEGPHSAPQFPAAYENVIGVTAVDTKDRVYLYANQGSYVDFAAAGVNAKVAKSPGTVETVSGTSYAAPVVAVALARLLPHADPKKAEAAQNSLARSARDLGEPGRDPVFGFGVIDSKH
jgi:hypothetical protein